MPKKIRIAAAISAVLAAALLCTGCSRILNELAGLIGVEEETDMSFVQYLKGLLDLDLTDLVQAEEGEYISEEMAYIRFQLADGSSGEVKELLESRYGEMNDEVDPDMLPGYLGHEIAGKLKSETLLGMWPVFLSGSGGRKTRSIELYLTTDGGDAYYLYFFG